MRILLDTHVFLWALVDDPRLTVQARDLLLMPQTELVVSTASIWEISIKYGLRRGDMPVDGESALSFARQAGYSVLPIIPEHAAAVDRLPGIHADPFDRMLVAQALHEPMRLMTHDAQLARYAESLVILF